MDHKQIIYILAMAMSLNIISFNSTGLEPARRRYVCKVLNKYKLDGQRNFW